MEDVDDGDGDADGDGDDGEGEGDDGDNDDDDGEGDQDDDDQDDADSPSQSQRPRGSLANGHTTPRPSRTDTNPTVLLTSPSPRINSSTSLGGLPFRPTIRPEALTAPVYDIIPTIATPHSTSINSITATPDMRWVFSGGADGYIRKFNWVDTANGKLALTVAQRHPFVDSVTKAGVLLSYWENEDNAGMVTKTHTLWIYIDFGQMGERPIPPISPPYTPLPCTISRCGSCQGSSLVVSIYSRFVTRKENE